MMAMEVYYLIVSLIGGFTPKRVGVVLFIHAIRSSRAISVLVPVTWVV